MDVQQTSEMESNAEAVQENRTKKNKPSVPNKKGKDQTIMVRMDKLFKDVEQSLHCTDLVVYMYIFS